jgi:hypothetical protein
MKKFVLSMAMAASLLCGGLFTSSAQAHGPYCGPRYGYGYGAYTGLNPYNNYRAPFPPYSAGYMGGWQPYRAYRQPHFGLYLGF